MAWNIFGKKETQSDIDIESHIRDLSIRDGRIIESDDVTYVKPMDGDPDGKVIGTVLKELERKNIVILNIRSLLSNKTALKEIIDNLKEACIKIDGDIGKISPEKIILVPSGVRIVHREE